MFKEIIIIIISTTSISFMLSQELIPVYVKLHYKDNKLEIDFYYYYPHLSDEKSKV